jgi:hypothetical protein
MTQPHAFLRTTRRCWRRTPGTALGAAAVALLGAWILVGPALCGEAPAPATGPNAGAGAAVFPKGPAEMEKLAKSDPLQFLRTALEWYDAKVRDYTCRFLKVEKIEGELRKPETMRMKFREAPFSVYVKWITDPSMNQEVIYVHGANKGMAVAHPSGILGALIRKVNVVPDSKRALKYSRRPITNAGMGNMLRLIIPQCERAKANGDLKLTYEGVRYEGGRPSYVFKRVLPKKNDYPCDVLLIYIDQEYLLCVRTDAYEWDGSLLSHYSYTDLKVNPGLTDEDFSPDNREYAYRLF